MNVREGLMLVIVLAALLGSFARVANQNQEIAKLKAQIESLEPQGNGATTSRVDAVVLGQGYGPAFGAGDGNGFAIRQPSKPTRHRMVEEKHIVGGASIDSYGDHTDCYGYSSTPATELDCVYVDNKGQAVNGIGLLAVGDGEARLLVGSSFIR